MSFFCLCLHNGSRFTHICLCLDDVIISWELTKRADFVAQNFIRFQATIRVFRGFDRLSNVSGSEVMAK